MKLSMANVSILLTSVAPRRGAWIETLEALASKLSEGGRTPQGCVD